MLTSVSQQALPLSQKAERAFKRKVIKYILIGLLSLPLFLPSQIFTNLFQTLSQFNFNIHWFVKLYLAINVVVLTYFLLVYLNAYRRQRKSNRQIEQQNFPADIVVNEEEIVAAFERTIFPDKSIVLINGHLYDLSDNQTGQLVKDICNEPSLKISNQ